ncbi:uncharacterized protein LOC144442459 [Glandiceps talaboti]
MKMEHLWIFALGICLATASPVFRQERMVGEDFVSTGNATIGDRWTVTQTRCRCYFDPSRFDCACCINGGCQCPEYSNEQCVQCGYGSFCGMKQPVIDGVVYDGWTGASECPCPDDPSDHTCACCINGGCLCPHNRHKCVQCGTDCGCDAGCGDGSCGYGPYGDSMYLNRDESSHDGGTPTFLRRNSPIPDSVDLGIGSGNIGDNQMTASSSVDYILGAHRGRLGMVSSYFGLGAWSALYLDQNQYLQIDLLYLTLITGVATQGRGGNSNLEYVTAYYFYYSNDGMLWFAYGGTEPMLLGGNSDADGIVRHNFEHGFHARYIRFSPQYYFGRISMRTEVYGIPPEIPEEERLGLANLALGNPAQFSSTYLPIYDARDAIDGIEDTGAAISEKQLGPWWYVDLLAHYHIFYVTIINIAPGVFDEPSTLKNFVVRVGDDPDIHRNPVCGHVYFELVPLGEMVQRDCRDHNGAPMSGQYVSIQLLTNEPAHLQLAEVLTYGVPKPLPGFYDMPDGSYYLGMESGAIDNAQITSSSHETGHEPFNGRLNRYYNAWIASDDDYHPYIIIDLLALHMITGIVTEGVPVPEESWVHSYMLDFSLDGNEFIPYMDTNGVAKEFEGNHDGYDIVPHVFDQPFVARLVKVMPTGWIRKPAMRIEIVGYKPEPVESDLEGHGVAVGGEECDSVDFDNLEGSIINPDICSAIFPENQDYFDPDEDARIEEFILQNLEVLLSDCLPPEILASIVCGVMYPDCGDFDEVMPACRQFCTHITDECSEELQPDSGSYGSQCGIMPENGHHDNSKCLNALDDDFDIPMNFFREFLAVTNM